jgi:hypothetical protein
VGLLTVIAKAGERHRVMARSANSGDIAVVCAIPYRIRDGRIELCLVLPPRCSRWEFPQSKVRPREAMKRAAVECAKKKAGVTCKLDPNPLDTISTTQEGRAITVAAFLLLARGEADCDSNCRSRWCFPEEARARIRRKPMRRLIDLALRRIAEKS